MIVTYLCDNAHHNAVLEAFHEGIEADKDVSDVSRYVPADVAVVFGVYKKGVEASYDRGKIIDRQKKAGKRVIVLETGYVNRGDGPDNHYAAGWGGLNNRADFKNEEMPPDRWEQLGVELKPWKQGERFVLCGQVPWDASVQNIDIVDWLVKTAYGLRIQSSRGVIYRPHPKSKEFPDFVPGCGTSKVSIEEDFERAFCFVTYNSNAAVLAVINGVPATYVDEGSMAKGVAGSLAHTLYPLMPDRQQWANNLAYTQWTPSEMREGLAWRHLSG